MDRRTLLFSAGAAALVGGGGAAAQASEPIATLRNVRIAGQAGEAVDLHLRDGRIAQIGRSLPASDGQDLDLSGKFVSPGLISAHCHIGSVQGVSVGAQFYTRENIARQLGVYAAYGVTTVASLGLNTDLFYAIQRDVRTGAIQGADLFGADRGFGVPNGGPPAQATSAQLFRPATEAEARANVRESIERGADFIKLWLDDFQGAHLVKMDPSIYRAIIDEAHRGGRKVIAHVYYLEDARAVLEAGADILGHGVRDRPVDQAFIDLMNGARPHAFPPSVSTRPSICSPNSRSCFRRRSFPAPLIQRFERSCRTRNGGRGPCPIRPCLNGRPLLQRTRPTRPPCTGRA